MTNTVEKNTCEDNSIVPPKYRILSGSWLKVIAVVTMLIDHIASVLLREDPILLFSVLGRAVTLYEIMRTIGRIAFPLFAFLLVEGFIHTSNRKKYGTNLLVFAFISELPWNLEHTGKLFCSSQNVFFTLFFGFIGLCIIENFKGKKRVGYLLIMLAITLIFHADYGCVGFGFILMLYILRENRLFQTVFGVCGLSTTWKSGLAFIPINLYNGKRGFIKGKFMKYAFYAFYPLHMFVLYLLKLLIGGGY